MLGRSLADPGGVEGPPAEVAGIGLLDVETVLAPVKTLRETHGRALGADFAGYEMHMGETTGPDCARAFARLAGNRNDGAMSADGHVLGSYVHGLLASCALRAKLLAKIGAMSADVHYAASVEAALDDIAAAIEAHLDVDALLALAGEAR